MNTEKIYAGIGSRETPYRVLEAMTKISIGLHDRGWFLRSGGASGADVAFAAGTSKLKVYYAEDATTEAIELAGRFHPAWFRCSDYVRALHGRNSMIILGKYLNCPVKRVICWTPGASLSGGTAMGIRIALLRFMFHDNLP